jgi:cellobiose phosphorylase
MVVYGTMEQQSRSIYEILQPYFWKAAVLTGDAATYAGKGIYNALSTGATWIYDKVVHTVIPYTK